MYNRKITFITKCRIIFGGFSPMGWFFLGFGMIFFLLFSMNADLSFMNSSAKNQSVQGEVTKIESTNSSINDQMVFVNYYKFNSKEGSSYKGSSYSTGKSLYEGQIVEVIYNDNNPKDSVIKGMRKKKFNAVALFVFIFLLGLFLIAYHIKKGTVPIIVSFELGYNSWDDM